MITKEELDKKIMEFDDLSIEDKATKLENIVREVHQYGVSPKEKRNLEYLLNLLGQNKKYYIEAMKCQRIDPTKNAKDDLYQVEKVLRNTIQEVEVALRQIITDVKHRKKKVNKDTIQKLTVKESLGEGIQGYLKDRIIQRTKEQLNPKCKLFKSNDSVYTASENLAKKIRKSGFNPEIIVGWQHVDNKKYQGSKVISELLAKYLKSKNIQIYIKEEGEKRFVFKSYDWVTNINKIIVADDACYSGKTLEAIKKGLLSGNPNLEIRFAVLSKHVDCHIKDIFYESTHNTEDLLFPWGWSRSIGKFQEIHELFGISDWRFFNRAENKWGYIESVSAELLSGVKLFSIKKKEMINFPSLNNVDRFLFVLSGSIEMCIEDQRGLINQNENVFIPRYVGYEIYSIEETKLLEISFSSSKS